ncbi:MAG: hypothetical protein JWO20_2115 [Candidatus Angelobacter sp.]|nr:hypothetical protein [Candidatus Angelobacter sp.]
MAIAQSPGTDVRLTNDFPGSTGYISAFTLATGTPYTDAVLRECSIARGRQNEPAVEVDPRNTQVLIGSSNDYCGVYSTVVNGTPVALGPIWLGYYRSENGGASFQSSLVPGYPGDISAFAALAQIRTSGAGDPVIAWDAHGRVFMGAESSGDPAGTKKTFGDVWVARYENPAGEAGNTINDGKAYRGTTRVAKGSSAPNLLGVFHDKTAIEADRTGGPCDGDVYFSWARFTTNSSNIYLVRSTDHGVTFSNPKLITTSTKNVQFPDIAVTGNGHVYVTFVEGTTNSGQPDAVVIAKSTDCGQSFSKPQVVTTFTPYSAQDVPSPQPIPIPTASLDDPLLEGDTAPVSTARDCGDFSDHCVSGYTFFRRDTQARSTADQLDKVNEWVYIVYDPTKPGTTVATGTTYGSIAPGTGSQSAVFFTRFDGAAGTNTTPVVLDNQTIGHQLFPDISAAGGVLHVLWWDSRNDPFYSPARPIGNNAAGVTAPSLDVFATRSTDNGANWATAVRVTDVTTNPNFEQFDNRQIPFAGDYLWVTSLGNFSFGVWTDWRNTVQGTDQRETTEDEDNFTADVHQCRIFSALIGAWSGDLCPHEGGIDQNIYGDHTP